MKSRLFVFAAILCGLAFAQGALAGGSSSGTRGGGNVRAAEFTEIASRMFQSLAMLPAPVSIAGFAIEPKRFIEELGRVKVFVSGEPLKLNGKAVNAINTRETREILFEAEAWSKMSLREKYKLVAHEFMALTFPQVSDLNYVYSNAILQLTDPEDSASLETFRCTGAGPFWQLTISKAGGDFRSEARNARFSRAVLGGIGITEAEYALSVKASDGTSELLGFLAKISGEPSCNVGEGNIYYPFQIQFFLNGVPFTGCCENGKYKAVEGSF